MRSGREEVAGFVAFCSGSAASAGPTMTVPAAAAAAINSRRFLSIIYPLGESPMSGEADSTSAHGALQQVGQYRNAWIYCWNDGILSTGITRLTGGGTESRRD